jgi:alkylation response protein AidB-like acyl-CoA dehydrogenase
METETAFDPALWKKIAEQGWCGIIFPEEYDGLGLGMVAMEEMGRVLVGPVSLGTARRGGPRCSREPGAK